MMIAMALVPGDRALHNGKPCKIASFIDGIFTAIADDGTEIIAPFTEFVNDPDANNRNIPVGPAIAQSRDQNLNATAELINNLRWQIDDLQKKLQQAEAERDAAADRAVALVAEAHAGTAPAAPPQTRIEVDVRQDISELKLAQLLNEGWGILHMQFMPRPAFDEDDRLNVVLQREVPVPPPPQPEARAAVPAPEPVRTVAGSIVQPEPVAAPEPAGVYASIIRRHDLPIAERIQMMNQHIIDEVMARSAARNPQPFTYRPLITGGIPS